MKRLVGLSLIALAWMLSGAAQADEAHGPSEEPLKAAAPGWAFNPDAGFVFQYDRSPKGVQ